MLKYKILIKPFVLNFVLIYCVYGDTIKAEVVVLCLLAALYASIAQTVTSVLQRTSLRR
jgi:hypothetical protein